MLLFEFSIAIVGIIFIIGYNSSEVNEVLSYSCESYVELSPETKS